MWLPFLLEKMNEKEMKGMGLKIKASDIYDINQGSLKDAVVIFGGGCTGEIISDKGLVLTNHHCGYGTVQGLSSVEHNYLKDGFWAKSKAEEIPAPGLSVQFLVKIEDVTAAVNSKLLEVKPNEIISKLPGILKEMSDKASEGTGYEVRVSSFFKGNQFLQFTYQRYTDVRLVGTPPESIGKFGGDTDNWEWPRHTGDFSIFRVYMAKDGKPAEFKTENVPYQPKHFLPVSIKELNDGDYEGQHLYTHSNRYKHLRHENDKSLVWGRRLKIRHIAVLRAEYKRASKYRIDSYRCLETHRLRQWDNVRAGFVLIRLLCRGVPRRWPIL